MNKLAVHIFSIETSDSLSLVGLKTDSGQILKTVLIDTPQTNPHLQLNQSLWATFKETEVVLGTDSTQAISLRNRLPGIIENIEQGKLLSRVSVQTADGPVISVISSEAVSELGLSEGWPVTCFVKLNEITLTYE